MAERELTKMNGSFGSKFFGETIDLINIDFTSGPSDGLRDLIKNNPSQLKLLVKPEIRPIIVSLVGLHDQGCSRCPNDFIDSSMKDQEGK